MITVSPSKDTEEIKRIFKEQNIEYCENSGCVIAKQGDGVLGKCLYNLDEKCMTILDIEPKDDIMLLDGILRSTLHIATERSIMKATYVDTSFESVFETLKFIKDKPSRTLDTDRLFGGCECNKNE